MILSIKAAKPYNSMAKTTLTEYSGVPFAMICFAVSMAASAVLTVVCNSFDLAWFTEGFRIIFLTVIISAAAAVFFPIQDENDAKEETK